MRVRFRVALGVRLDALLAVLPWRYGDPDMSRGNGDAAEVMYRCPKCKAEDSSAIEQTELLFCQKCRVPMDPVGN